MRNSGTTLRPRVAIVDCGAGNLASVRLACEAAGLDAAITRDRRVIDAAGAIILPGVGAFSRAMQTLREADLVAPLRTLAAAGRLILGICLGMQLLMEESSEGGRHDGLGLLAGDVVRFDPPRGDGPAFKIPHMGWNRVRFAAGNRPPLLAGVPDGTAFYFVHSYYVRPADGRAVVARTRYGGGEFCSIIGGGNLIGCQFHPERSARAGAAIFRSLAATLGAQEHREALAW